MRSPLRHGILTVALLALALGACGRTSGGGDVDESTGGQAAVASGGATGSGGALPSGGTSPSGGAEATAGSGGQDASSGGLGSGGQGSGGESPICPGVVPECEPGVQGCSERGEAYLCSECGSMDLLGESCVRLLASDKEMGQVCSVRGETDLLCWGGPVEWDTTLVFPIVLPEFPTVFRLPDDVISTTRGAYCWIDESGGMGCSEDIPLSGGSDCTDLALSDSLGTCSLCAGQLECSNHDVSEAGVAQAGLSDTMPFWLTNEGSVYYPISDEPILTGSYSFIIMRDNELPCGIRDDGALVCASYGAGTELELEGDFVRGSANIVQVCVIDAAGAISCFDFTSGTFSPAFSPPGSDFVDVVASNLKACGLTRAGVVVCWDDVGMLDEFSAKLN